MRVQGSCEDPWKSNLGLGRSRNRGKSKTRLDYNLQGSLIVLVSHLSSRFQRLIVSNSAPSSEDKTFKHISPWGT